MDIQKNFLLGEKYIPSVFKLKDFFNSFKVQHEISIPSSIFLNKNHKEKHQNSKINEEID